MTDYFVVEPCTTANGFEIKLKNRTIDLEKAGKAISSLGEVLASSPIVLLAKVRNYSISIYASGRMMIKSEKRISEKQASELAKKLIPVFEKKGAILED